MKLKKMALLILITGGALSVICPGFVYAGAAYIYEMGNSSDTGYAGAGLAARANVAGTVFTNPAGMTRFKESTALAGFTGVYIHAPFDPSNTTVDGKDGDTNVIVPGGNLGYIHPVSDDLKLGISMQNFFGLSLDWQNDWVGRYSSTSVTVIAPQLQPTAAYRVTEWLSIGVGAGLTLGYLSDKGAANNLDPNLGDGKFKFSDTDFAVQGNFGIMIEPSERTRFGVRYLTETELNFKDNLYTSGTGPGIADLTKSVGKINLGMNMPQSIMAGAYHRLNDKWAILGSVGWDDWSRFGKINIDISNTEVDTVADADFDDTYHVGVGAEYQYNPKLMLTAGFSYDSSMSDSDTRPIDIPLGDMYRYGVGFKYRKSNGMTLGGGLSFLWEGALPVKRSGNAQRGFVSGKYENTNLTFLSLYVQW
jgi:long-chain fatty acid transport protein